MRRVALVIRRCFRRLLGHISGSLPVGLCLLSLSIVLGRGGILLLRSLVGSLALLIRLLFLRFNRFLGLDLLVLILLVNLRLEILHFLWLDLVLFVLEALKLEHFLELVHVACLDIVRDSERVHWGPAK